MQWIVGILVKILRYYDCLELSSSLNEHGEPIVRAIIPAAALALSLAAFAPAHAQEPDPAPPATDARIYEIVAASSPARVEADIRTLAGFGTRSTLSDTLSDTRGIGAARRWIKAEFDRISASCG